MMIVGTIHTTGIEREWIELKLEVATNLIQE
jgi:hypothetical protein